MASTNKTTNYELSQFLGTDKPAWLSDYNSDMSKIDTQMKANADAATAAGGSADAATTAIGTLTNLTTDDKTSLVAAVNEVDSHADTAQGTANSAATTANEAKTGVDGLSDYLNLGATRTELTKANMTISGIGSIANSTKIQIIGNEDKSLIKIYGSIPVSNVQDASEFTITVSGTGLAPTSDINITGAGLVTHDAVNPTRVTAVDPVTYTIKQNGDIVVKVKPYGGATGVNIKFIACVIFVKNFGD